MFGREVKNKPHHLGMTNILIGHRSAARLGRTTRRNG